MKYKKMKLDPMHSEAFSGMKEPTHYVLTDFDGKSYPSRKLAYSAEDAEIQAKATRSYCKASGKYPNAIVTIFQVIPQ